MVIRGDVAAALHGMDIPFCDISHCQGALYSTYMCML